MLHLNTERAPLLGATSLDREHQFDIQPFYHTHIYTAHSVRTAPRPRKEPQETTLGNTCCGNTCAWEDLPSELVENIFKYLTLRDKVACASTCTWWRQICMSDNGFRGEQRQRIDQHLWMKQMRDHGRRLVEKKRVLRKEQFKQALLEKLERGEISESQYREEDPEGAEKRWRRNCFVIGGVIVVLSGAYLIWFVIFLSSGNH